jgi:hypothetical protein
MRRYRLRGVGALGVDHKLGGIAITLRVDLAVKSDFNGGITTCASPSMMRTAPIFSEPLLLPPVESRKLAAPSFVSAAKTRGPSNSITGITRPLPRT